MTRTIKSYTYIILTALALGTINLTITEELNAEIRAKWFVECSYGADGQLHTMRCTIDGDYGCNCPTSVIEEESFQ